MIVRIGPGQYKDTATGKVVKGMASLQAAQKALGGQAAGGGNAAGGKKKSVTGPVKPVTNTETTPFGSQVVSQDKAGNITTTSTLDPNQQKIVEQDAALSQAGRDLAKDALGKVTLDAPTARITTGQANADRARIEEAAYNRLTRNFARDEARAMQNTEQALANRGIPANANDPQYKAFVDAERERWANARSDAMNNAVQLGGQEWQRDYTINEGVRANQMGEISNMASFGQGAQIPQFQNQVSNMGNPNEIAATNKALAAEKEQARMNAAIARMKASNSGSSSADSAFSSSTPPGYGG